MATKKQTTTSEKIILDAQTRTEVGKKVKSLRKQGLIPANVFGQDFKSQSIKIGLKDFTLAYKQAHETGIIYVNVDKDSIPTLVTSLQRDPLRHSILHIDFRKVNLKQKIETEVPILIVGESEAVHQHGGELITQNDHITIEALPSDIPANIEIDISALKEVGSDIKVSDIAKNAAYTITMEPETVIVSVTAHKEESVVPETAAPETEVIGAEGEEGAEGATAEGEAPAEGGEAAAEDKKE